MSFALGETLALSLGLMMTEHVSFCPECNEVHPYATLSLSTPVEQVDIGLTAFLNSQSKLGVMLGGEYRSTATPWGLDLGVAFGYETDWPAIPVGRVVYSLGTNVELFAAPSPTKFDSLDHWSVIIGIDLEF